MDEISRRALRTIEKFDHLHSTQPQLLELVFDMTALAWAFEFVLCLHPVLHRSIQEVELEIGKELDRRLTNDSCAL